MSALYPTPHLGGPSTGAAPVPPLPTPHTMSEQLLAPLAELTALTHTLFHALSPAPARPPPVPPLGAFLDADAALAAAVRTARAHQLAHAANARRKDALLALEARWRAVVAQLEAGRRELADILEEGAERVRAVEDARAAAIPYPELLQYAHSLSAFTSAPPNMPALAPGQPPPPLFFPPFPNEEKMRRGHMNAEAPLGGVGEVRDVGKARTVSPHPIERPQHMGGPNPFRMDHREHQGVFDLDLDLNPDL